MVKVSVIVPVYGVEKYIKKCISSIINQTFSDFEIIIVDDGTKDNSIKIIEDNFHDERIKIFHKENGGLARARNYGITKASGKYMFFVDSDDFLEPNCLSEMYNEIINKDVDMVICDLPCSGLGIIGKKPDIKYNASPEKIKELSVLQRQILKNVVRYLKPDGYLIYSTCTVSPFENYDTVQYIKNELGLSPVNIADYLPDGMKMRSGLNEECCIQLLPGEYGSDGFFISIFRRMP